MKGGGFSWEAGLPDIGQHDIGLRDTHSRRFWCYGLDLYHWLRRDCTGFPPFLAAKNTTEHRAIFPTSPVASGPAVCGRIFRIPLLIPASSAPRYRKTAEPHISRSQKAEIAGKRPVFRGLEIAILTLSGRSSGRDPKMTGSGNWPYG